MVREFMGQKRTDEMLDLGAANLEVLRQMDQWCKHFQATQTSAGMLAEMSGLPIGSFRLSCHHAKFTPEGMNLPWISQDFLEENCKNCPHHKPKGDPAWGNEVLAKVAAAKEDASRRKNEVQRVLDEVRAQCKARAGQARKDDNLSEHQILVWADQLFDSDAGIANAACQKLTESARLAPELFGVAVIEALCVATTTPELNGLALSPLAALADKRTDLHPRLEETAVTSIEHGMGLELGCAILSKTQCNWTPEKRRDVIERVVGLRNHIRPIGGWPKRDPRCALVDIPPDYDFSNAFLIREYDQKAEAVLGPITTALRSPDPHRRINACGIISGLMQLRPQLGNALASDLATSLELVESEFGESADDAAGRALAQAFLIDPISIDTILSDHIKSRNASVQEQLIEVYTRVLRSSTLEFENDAQPADQQKVAAADVALRRVLQLLQDRALDVGPLFETVEAIRTASRDYPNQAISHHETLLGTLAEWSLQSEARPLPPAIILPGQMPKPSALVAMEKRSRDMKWQSIKRELVEVLKELIEVFPTRFADPLANTFENLDSKTHQVFKAEVTRLLGLVGQTYDLLPRVLPVIWSAIMDTSSVLVRCRGIEAIGECFRYSKQAPPSDVVDILVLDLNDPYKIVHQAAVRVIGDNANWLTEEQSVDALQRLGILVQAYKADGSYELERIADALLDVSRRFPKTRVWAVKQVVALMQSGDDLMDLKLTETMIRGVRPGEQVAYLIAAAIIPWIGESDDDDNLHATTAEEAFAWLHGLPSSHFRQVRDLAIEHARKTANRMRLTLCFASLFATNADYESEREILGLARSELPSGARFAQACQLLDALRDAATRNANRVTPGDM